MVILCGEGMKAINREGSRKSNKIQEAIDNISTTCPIGKVFDFNKCRIRHFKAKKDYERQQLLGIAVFNFCKDCEFVLTKIKEHSKTYCKVCHRELTIKRVRRNMCRSCYENYLKSRKAT